MKPLIFLGLFFCVGQVYAGSNGVNAGSSMSLGASSNHYSLQSAYNNPAKNSLVVEEGEKWRLSYFPSISFNSEVGNVNNFADDLDELIDIIDDPSSTDDDANDVLDRFNATLVQMGNSGYFKANTNINAPFLPLVYQSDVLGGSLGLGMSVRAQLGLRILDDEISFDDQNGTFSTATSLYLKGATEKMISLSYSRSWFTDNKRISDKGTLYGGIKAKLISLELSKQVMPIQQLDGKDVGDVVQDEYDNNLKSTTGLGIDIGVVWDAERYRVGLTLENLNSPKFDYGTVGENCADIEENTLPRTNCEVAANFIQNRGDLRARETHTMNAYLRADGLYKLTDRWMVSSSLDLAKYDDAVGFENQWWHLATSYEFKNIIFPSARVGYQKNIAGGETSSLVFGLTMLKYFSLDLEWGLDSVSIDGSSAPRRFGFTLGVEERF